MVAGIGVYESLREERRLECKVKVEREKERDEALPEHVIGKYHVSRMLTGCSAGWDRRLGGGGGYAKSFRVVTTNVLMLLVFCQSPVYVYHFYHARE